MFVGRSGTPLALLAAAAAILSCTSIVAAGGHDRGLPGTHIDHWSGIYIGGSLGAGGGDANFVVPSGLTVSPNPIDLDEAIVGGLHVGIQRQWGHTVAGIETSVLFADLNGTSFCPNLADRCSVDSNWIWMIGPRLGFAANKLHFYATGGYALGRLASKAVDGVSGALLDSGHARHSGWYLGGGIEWSLRPNVVLGVEYRRIDLAHDTHESSLGIPAAAREVDAEIDTIQARLTLKFGR